LLRTAAAQNQITSQPQESRGESAPGDELACVHVTMMAVIAIAIAVGKRVRN